MSQKVFTIVSSTAQYNDDELQFLDSLEHFEGVFGDPDTGIMGLQVSERGTPDMNVEVDIGDAYIEVAISGRTFKAVLKNTATETVAIAANVSGSDRVDAIIARIDVDTEPDVLKTNIGTIERVNGTSATALTDGAITTAVGSDGWIRLADVTVPNSASSISNVDISDKRVKVATTAAVKIEDASNPSLTEDDTTTSAVLESQTASTSTIGFGEPDTSGNNNDLSQTFIASKTKMRGVRLFKKPDSGSFTGTVTIALQAEVAGAPSGSDLASVTISNTDYLALADNLEFETLFTTEYDGLVVGATYWIVATASTADAVNHPNLGGATGNPYADGGAYFNNATDGWTAIALTDLYFETLEGNANQVVKTGDNGQIAGVMPGKVTVYEADDIWVKPDGLSYIVVEMVGGGGGSSGADLDANRPYPAGAGAGYARKLFRANELPPSVALTVGIAGIGTAAASNCTPASAATASLFGDLITCNPGGAGDCSASGIGGTATGGDINIDGQNGEPDNINDSPPNGGGSYLGLGGINDDGDHGNPATGYGAGASGGGTDRNGSDGSPGVIIITEY